MSDKKPLVSVLMTSYNAGMYIRQSVSSVQRQTYGTENIQFIVVDDGSDDHSCDFLEDDPGIELYRLPKNQNISCATNFGMTKVRGEYMAIIDSDDIWLEEKLDKQIDWLLHHPEDQACFTWVHLIDENGEAAGDRIPHIRELFMAHNRTREAWLRHFFFRGNCLSNPSSVVTVRAMKEIGDHNPAFVQGQDFDWWIRFTKLYSFHIIEEPLIYYRRFISHVRENTSSEDEHKNARFYNEEMQMRYHYFDAIEEDLFLRAFRPFFYNESASTQEELEFEKALLIADSYGLSQEASALGAFLIDNYLHAYCGRYEESQTYQNALRIYHDMMKGHIYADTLIEPEKREQLRIIKKLAATIDHSDREESALNESCDEQSRKLAEMTAADEAKDRELASLRQLIEVERQKNDLPGNLHRHIKGWMSR